MTELKSCPFCGGPPFLDNLSESGTDRYSWYVRCTVCEVQQIVNNGSRAEAVALWNRRAGQDGRRQAIEECAKVADDFFGHPTDVGRRIRALKDAQ